MISPSETLAIGCVVGASITACTRTEPAADVGVAAALAGSATFLLLRGEIVVGCVAAVAALVSFSLAFQEDT